MTGVGERSHLTSPDIDLETHILDIVNLIRWEELSDVVLCGHSYGGAVIEGAADRIPDSIRALVYLDAFVLENGENLIQHTSEGARNRIIGGANNSDEVWKVAPIPAETFRVNAEDLDWVNRQCTPHPRECFRQTITLTGGIQSIENVTYILTDFGASSSFQAFYEKAEARGWKTLILPCDHDAMLDLPEELTKALIESVY